MRLLAFRQSNVRLIRQEPQLAASRTDAGICREPGVTAKVLQAAQGSLSMRQALDVLGRSSLPRIGLDFTFYAKRKQCGLKQRGDGH